MTNETQNNIKELKKEYSILEKKYKLPAFEKLAEDFDIEGVIEKETSFILRDVRRAINDKLGAYLRLCEMFLAPESPSLFVFSILGKINEDDKKSVKEIHYRLARLQLEAIRLDTIYDEKKEAEFIVQITKEWQVLKVKIYDIIGRVDKKFDSSSKVTKQEYFG